MRIAYVCADPGVPVFGHKGCSVHVQEVLRAFAGRGFEVDLFATRFDGDTPAGLEGVRPHRLPPAPKGDLPARERASLAANTDVAAALERVGPFDMVYERYSLWSFAAVQYAAARGVPGLLEVNAPLIEEQARHRGLHDRAAAEDAARRAFGAASAVIAVSDEVARHVAHAWGPETQGRVHVLPNGVNPERFRPGTASALPADPDTFTVGFVGSMKPWHGLPVLIEAFARLHAQAPHSRLVVVGEGSERPHVEAEVGRRGLTEAVTLTGAVRPDFVPGLLASMDVAVAPYPATERFYFSPLKVYEYMAAGLPVVASRVGPIEAVVRDGENGLLLPAGDAGALADALLRLRNDAGLRRRLGRAARETVLHGHTWDDVLERILAAASGSRVRQPVPRGDRAP